METSNTVIANPVDDNHGGTKEIWRTFWILLVLTIVELILGYILIGVESTGMRMALKGFIIILMLAKAFYIVAYFMHLKSEIKNLIITIIVPLSLLIWAIAAFLYDGNSYRHNRNAYDPFKRDRSNVKAINGQPEEKVNSKEKRKGAIE
jgi:cytochrome c oxidase subunit 4